MACNCPPPQYPSLCPDGSVWSEQCQTCLFPCPSGLVLIDCQCICPPGTIPDGETGECLPPVPPDPDPPLDPCPPGSHRDRDSGDCIPDDPPPPEIPTPPFTLSQPETCTGLYRVYLRWEDWSHTSQFVSPPCGFVYTPYLVNGYDVNTAFWIGGPLALIDVPGPISIRFSTLQRCGDDWLPGCNELCDPGGAHLRRFEVFGSNGVRYANIGNSGTYGFIDNIEYQIWNSSGPVPQCAIEDYRNPTPPCEDSKYGTWHCVVVGRPVNNNRTSGGDYPFDIKGYSDDVPHVTGNPNDGYEVISKSITQCLPAVPKCGKGWQLEDLLPLSFTPDRICP